MQFRRLKQKQALYTRMRAVRMIKRSFMQNILFRTPSVDCHILTFEYALTLVDPGFNHGRRADGGKGG